MTTRREPLYLALITSSGSWIAVSAIALFILMLAMLFGPFEACSGGGVTGYPPRIGVWLPESTPASVAQRAETAWRASAPTNTAWTSAASLAELVTESVDVVLVPHARHLTQTERNALGRHQAGGGGVVVVGAIGVRDSADEWLGWDGTRAFLGVQTVAALERAQTFFISTGARSPLSAALPPGQRIAVAPEDGAPALAIDDAPLHWATFSREPVSSMAAAALTLERGAGRLVWLAVGPEYAADGASVIAMAQLGRAALSWAGRIAIAEVAPWPDGARFAALLAMDAAGSETDAQAVAAIADPDALPITMLASAATEHDHYALDEPGSDRLVPRMMPVENGDIPEVWVTRTSRDDRDLIERAGLTSPEALATAALEDARRVAAQGGLYALAFRSEGLAAPGRIGALPLIARGLRDEGAWIASGPELTDWWRARSRLETRLDRSGPRRVTLHVANEGPTTLERAFVRIHLQQPISKAALRPVDALQGVREDWLAPAPRLQVAVGDPTVGVSLPPLPPGARWSWHLDWSSQVH